MMPSVWQAAPVGDSEPVNVMDLEFSLILSSFQKF